MLIDFNALSGRAAYHVMVQTIIPRPIAWVLSDNGDGGHNLAPFSYFNGVTGSPPLIMISVGRKPGGERKDTWVNIDARQHFVVHLPSRDEGEAMVASSEPLAHGHSEVTKLGLKTTREQDWPLPRLAGSRLAMWCERYQIIEVGDGPQGLILGRIRAMFLDDAAARQEGDRIHIDPAALDPIARLGGQDYVLFGEKVTIARPG